MTNLLLILLLFVGCDNPFSDKTRNVLVQIGRDDTTIYLFGIFKNGDEIFSATECGVNHNSVNECVDFTIPYLGQNLFEYEFEAEEEDVIGILATVCSDFGAGCPDDLSCYKSVSAKIYSDDIIKESYYDDCDNDDDDCDDCESGFYIDTTLD
tara:strand:- start:514 stop:972 length:459 start_codon:yes stop_codon:yes gene_type:complete